MSNEKVFQMKLQKVYPLLVAKAEKKGRSRGEVDAAACWLTGYSQEQLAALLESDIAYGDFFRQAPAPHPNRGLITGSHLFWVGAFLSKRKRATAQGSGPLWRDTQILTL